MLKFTVTVNWGLRGSVKEFINITGLLLSIKTVVSSLRFCVAVEFISKP